MEPLDDEKLRLIVGLGNPGKSYEKTRHNMGFLVVERLAEKHSLPFRSSLRFKAKVAKGVIDGIKVILLMPQTYMNLSGDSVRSCLNYAKVPLKNLLVVADDVALPFGKVRLREKGSSGGHNGLNDIEKSLASQEYRRLRLGVGNHPVEELKSYVLSPFSPKELDQLELFVDKAASVVEAWLQDGMQRAYDVLSQTIEGE